MAQSSDKIQSRWRLKCSSWKSSRDKSWRRSSSVRINLFHSKFCGFHLWIGDLWRETETDTERSFKLFPALPQCLGSNQFKFVYSVSLHLRDWISTQNRPTSWSIVNDKRKLEGALRDGEKCLFNVGANGEKYAVELYGKILFRNRSNGREKKREK